MSTATFTELLRKPKAVLAKLDCGQVHITRTDGDDLVIMREHDLAILEQGAALSSRLMRSIAEHHNNAPAALTSMFAWVAEFSKDELRMYADEITQLVYSSSELSAYNSLLQAQREWRETARAYASGMRPAAGSFALPVDLVTAERH
jgi:hypothetical protein